MAGAILADVSAQLSLVSTTTDPIALIGRAIKGLLRRPVLLHWLL